MNRLAILLWAATPEQPDLCAAPFVYAAAAAALDCEVEVHFAGPSVKLLVPGFAERAVTSGGKDIYAFMIEASSLGVRFFACSMAAGQHIPDETAMIPELSAAAGATAFVARVIDPDWRTLVF